MSNHKLEAKKLKEERQALLTSNLSNIGNRVDAINRRLAVIKMIQQKAKDEQAI